MISKMTVDLEHAVDSMVVFQEFPAPSRCERPDDGADPAVSIAYVGVPSD
jgi:hypothetical protein